MEPNILYVREVLPNIWLAQTCELYALKQVPELLKGQEDTIYTDSKYTYGVVYNFGKVVQNRASYIAKERNWSMEN
jgi:hypothetical protein